MDMSVPVRVLFVCIGNSCRSPMAEGFANARHSDVMQAVADVAYRNDRVDAGVSLTFADTRLNGNGPAPVELLEVDRSAVFTYPDTTENQLAFGQGRLNVALSPEWTLQFTAFARAIERKTLNGDEADFDVCDDDALPTGAPAGTLCVGGVDDDDEEEGEIEPVAIVDVASGRFITLDDAAGDAIAPRMTVAVVHAAMRFDGAHCVFILCSSLRRRAVFGIPRRRVQHLPARVHFRRILDQPRGI